MKSATRRSCNRPSSSFSAFPRAPPPFVYALLSAEASSPKGENQKGEKEKRRRLADRMTMRRDSAGTLGLWSSLPDELTLAILSACDSVETVAAACLVCRDWGRVGHDALVVVAARWAQALLAPRDGGDPKDQACAVVCSAVALDKPHRLALLLDALPDFSLEARVSYRPIIEARGYARLTGSYQPTRFSVPRPHHPLYGCYVPAGDGLLAFAVGCGAVQCVEALAARHAPVCCTREALVWSALWASTRAWRLCAYRPRPRRCQDDLWHTVAHLPAVDGARLVDAVLALPIKSAPAGAECIRPLHALLIVTGHTLDNLGHFWRGRSRDELIAWATAMMGRFVRAGYGADDLVVGPDPNASRTERQFLALRCAECNSGDRAFYQALLAALDDRGASGDLDIAAHTLSSSSLLPPGNALVPP
ncbi:F-box domain containing protein [Pandoravirus quercus]|uniref:F-box domain containing protein n=1 Tax=Pandoravirus quercus TaxID=2107709 RepID=A0A2U7U7U5_9VIRU|nr:F-box domain containing protein [Pandoravirus quercus]AVK74494.1 F-box domain containing protein [Pandoravirus quercus]